MGNQKGDLSTSGAAASIKSNFEVDYHIPADAGSALVDLKPSAPMFLRRLEHTACALQGSMVAPVQRSKGDVQCRRVPTLNYAEGATLNIEP